VKVKLLGFDDRGKVAPVEKAVDQVTRRGFDKKQAAEAPQPAAKASRATRQTYLA